MRALVAYTLEARRQHKSDPTLDTVASAVEGWLASKGTISANGTELRFTDGRVGELQRSHTDATIGQINDLTLTETTPGGWFRTTVSAAQTLESLGISVVLSAGSFALAPHTIDVHCPRVVRSLLALPVEWRYRGTVVRATPARFSGAAGGDAFVALVWDEYRSLPVVVVSDEYGAVLHPGIIEELAKDLAGVAVVASLDPDASWRLSARHGKEWSCYGGAIRLYWPDVAKQTSPFSSPLWTARRLLDDVADSDAAALRLRNQLRRRIFAQAAFAITESAFFGSIRKGARDEELGRLRQLATESADIQSLANDYNAKVDRLSAIVDTQDEEIRSLRQQLANANLALRWQDKGGDDVAPVEETPPETVEDAVLMAQDKYNSLLDFGSDVNVGMRGVRSDAGPPDKILSYLDRLAELTEARKRGPIGNTVVKWLTERGATCSGESETIQNSPKDRALRTWDDAHGSTKYFDLHLKPNEGTSPDRCVRIYFDWDEERRKHVVGWVGRKPGL